VQEAIGGYFRDPSGTVTKKGTSVGGAQPQKKEMVDNLNALKEDLMRNLEKMAEFDKLKKQIEIKVTPEGLRIELIESSKGTFFENGKAQPTPVLRDLLKILANETGKLPNPISIEGHTDANPFTDPTSYSNWELSTDRANAARRLMDQSGLQKGQVVQVRGYADHALRKPEAPGDPSNRRISIIIQYMPQSAPLPSKTFDGKFIAPPTDEKHGG
jgi:chemotaxis protein MotB